MIELTPGSFEDMKAISRACAEQLRHLPPMKLLPVPADWPGPVVMYGEDGTAYAVFTRDDLPRDAGPSLLLPGMTPGQELKGPVGDEPSY
ncbi:hypothetical protein [Streptomyces sp. NPDC001536]|uniref:hypothetical protein n=1 Tax=Streptomyces sp. NPDC001536 TaxID=3364583 RepID=UPI0036B9EA7E